MTEKIHRVRQEDLEVGAQVERSEHPWASQRIARHLAKDHLQKDPSAYSSGKQSTEREVVVVLNQNVKAISPRKKKSVQRQQQPQSNAPGWIPQGMRLWG